MFEPLSVREMIVVVIGISLVVVLVFCRALIRIKRLRKQRKDYTVEKFIEDVQLQGEAIPEAVLAAVYDELRYWGWPPRPPPRPEDDLKIFGVDGEDWEEVIENIAKKLGHYDRVNRWWATLGVYPSEIKTVLDLAKAIHLCMAQNPGERPDQKMALPL